MSYQFTLPHLLSVAKIHAYAGNRKLDEKVSEASLIIVRTLISYLTCHLDHRSSPTYYLRTGQYDTFVERTRCIVVIS
jgi:hypothetical protein